MDNQILLEVARLVSVQSKLLVIMAGAMLVGLVVLGWEIYAVSQALRGITASLEGNARALHDIASMTAEVLRRTRPPSAEGPDR